MFFKNSWVLLPQKTISLFGLTSGMTFRSFKLLPTKNPNTCRHLSPKSRPYALFREFWRRANCYEKRLITPKGIWCQKTPVQSAYSPVEQVFLSRCMSSSIILPVYHSGGLVARSTKRTHTLQMRCVLHLVFAISNFFLRFWLYPF